MQVQRHLNRPTRDFNSVARSESKSLHALLEERREMLQAVTGILGGAVASGHAAGKDQAERGNEFTGQGPAVRL